MATLDVVHRVEALPSANQKVTSAAQFVAAGGPAANAAVTFAALGGKAILVTALGDDPVADLIRSDLAAYGVRVVDAAAGKVVQVPVSAVSVLVSTGDRSVVSLDAVTSTATPPAELESVIAGADVVLIDGHHPVIAVAAAKRASEKAIRVVVDAGRWKPVMHDLVEHATDMVCSDDFRLPGMSDSASTAAALVGGGTRTVITTHGGEPVRWWQGGLEGSVPAHAVTVVDTLGAGDVFHGAYAYYSSLDIAERIDRAAAVAAVRVSVIGPREWLHHLPSTPHLSGKQQQ